MSDFEDVKIARLSAAGTSTFAAIFGLSIVLSISSSLDYASSLGIALTFLSLTVANESIVARTRGLDRTNVYARLSVAFACIYCAQNSIVYFTQLTFVRWGSPSPEALSIVSFEPPRTAYFAIDMLGYFFMSLSMLCLGWTVDEPSRGVALKKLILALGFFGGTCVAVPLLPFNYQEGADETSTAFGIAALVIWTVLYVPIMAALARHYELYQTEPFLTNKNI